MIRSKTCNSSEEGKIMVFSSITFIFYFLPIFLAIYYLIPKRLKNVALVIGSLVFYYFGVKDRPVYVLLMMISVFVNYITAIQMDKTEEKAVRKRWLAVGLFYNFGWLFVFKYMDFFSGNLNALAGLFGKGIQIPYVNLVLPIGISFYTFQISSYLIDVYWEKIKAERSILSLGTYLCMFPQLIAGPIVTYSSVKKQLKKRSHSFFKLEQGLREFTIGLGLKVLIANQAGSLWNQVNAIGFESISTPLAWLGIWAYTFQIYFDFYGYSLMAKGLGQMLGFRFPDNFHNPYLALSMTDFWRRWHITLGSWFREYVYIPMGGNRRHMLINTFVVWMLTGFWHGASWNFILWGFLLFLLIIIEKKGLGKFLEKYPAAGHLYMMFVIPLSWLVFSITDLGQMRLYLTRLFPFLGTGGNAVFQGDFIKYGKMYLISLLAAVICCTGYPRKLYEKKKYHFLTGLFLVAVFWACVYCMYIGMDDPFLYFQF